MDDDPGYFSPEECTDEDLLEILLLRAAELKEQDISRESKRIVSEHGGAEQALKHVESRLEAGLDQILNRIKEDARVYGILVAARDEISEELDQDEQNREPDPGRDDGSNSDGNAPLN